MEPESTSTQGGESSGGGGRAARVMARDQHLFSEFARGGVHSTSSNMNTTNVAHNNVFLGTWLPSRVVMKYCAGLSVTNTFLLSAFRDDFDLKELS
jgi:hypothetical protein